MAIHNKLTMYSHKPTDDTLVLFCFLTAGINCTFCFLTLRLKYCFDESTILCLLTINVAACAICFNKKSKIRNKNLPNSDVEGGFLQCLHLSNATTIVRDLVIPPVGRLESSECGRVTKRCPKWRLAGSWRRTFYGQRGHAFFDVTCI